MDEALPKDAISLLEDKKKFSKIKTVAATFAILLLTFAIPATITQFYKINLIQSGAQSVTPTPTISYILGTSQTPTVTQTPTPTIIISPVVNSETVINGQVSYSLLDFIRLNLWILPLGGVLLASWIGLIIMYLHERKYSAPTTFD